MRDTWQLRRFTSTSPKAYLSSVFGNGARPAQYGFHPRQQFTNGKWLGDVVVGAQFKSHHLVDFLSAGSKHDDRNRGPLRLELLAHVQPAHPRHHDVQDDEVGGLGDRALQASHTVAGGDDLMSLEFEVVAQPGHHVGLVLDNQDFGHVLWSPVLRQRCFGRS